MKKLFIYLSLILFSLTSCSTRKNNNDELIPDYLAVYVNFNDNSLDYFYCIEKEDLVTNLNFISSLDFKICDGEALFENERVAYLYFIYELDEDLYSCSSYILSSDNKIFNDFEVDNNHAYSYLNKYTSETIKIIFIQMENLELLILLPYLFIIYLMILNFNNFLKVLFCSNFYQFSVVFVEFKY